MENICRHKTDIGVSLTIVAWDLPSIFIWIIASNACCLILRYQIRPYGIRHAARCALFIVHIKINMFCLLIFAITTIVIFPFIYCHILARSLCSSHIVQHFISILLNLPFRRRFILTTTTEPCPLAIHN